MLGTRLKEARRNAGITQRKLAELLGFSSHHVTVARWEAGKYEIDYTTLARIAEILGVTQGWLLGEDDPQQEDQPVDTKLATASDVQASADKIAGAILDQKEAFVRAVEQQRAEYAQVIDRLAGVLDRQTQALDRLTGEMNALRTDREMGSGGAWGRGAERHEAI
jgi:transcriptional regulator with XRE-family HTH domain